VKEAFRIRAIITVPQPWHQSGKSRGIYKGAEPPCTALLRTGAGETI